MAGAYDKWLVSMMRRLGRVKRALSLQASAAEAVALLLLLLLLPRVTRWADEGRVGRMVNKGTSQALDAMCCCCCCCCCCWSCC